MKSPKVNVQTETPAEVAAREVEQQRAEATQIQQTQGLNAAATIRRTRRFGKLFGGGGGSSNTGGLNIRGLSASLNGPAAGRAGSGAGSNVSFNGRGQAVRVVE